MGIIDTTPLAFFNTDAFAQNITYTVAASNDTYILKAIFEDPYFTFDGGGAPVSSSTPTIQLRTKDLPNGYAADDTIVLTDFVTDTEKTFKVKEIQRDGTGISLIYLQLQ